jgi:phosphatidate cytidylyltransferase
MATRSPSRGPSGRSSKPPRDPDAPRRPGSDVWARIVVAVPAIVVALVLVAAGGIVFTVGLIAIGAVCMHELFEMYERAHPVRLAGFLGLAGLLLAAHYGSQYQILLVAMAFIPVLFGLTLMQPKPSVGGMAITILGLYWIGFALAHAVLLRDLPHGEGVVIDVLVGTFLGDTGAYFGGRMFGSRPLAPRISPNKTVEGLLIGMLVAVAGVWLASRYQDWFGGTHALLLGLGVAIAGPVGDLFESFIKREAGTKDTGRVFGAHGGALDRLDAVLFTAVISYYIWSAWA